MKLYKIYYVNKNYNLIPLIILNANDSTEAIEQATKAYDYVNESQLVALIY